MGRYYHGDIKGKFWFAIQNSDDASNFGGTESPVFDSWEYQVYDKEETVTEQVGLSYHFTEEDLPDIESGIKLCLEGLGPHKEKMDQFFSDNVFYTRETLWEFLDLTSPKKLDDLLVLYARLGLGNKIRDCVIEKGKCSFEAEI